MDINQIGKMIVDEPILRQAIREIQVQWRVDRCTARTATWHYKGSEGSPCKQPESSMIVLDCWYETRLMQVHIPTTTIE